MEYDTREHAKFALRELVLPTAEREVKRATTTSTLTISLDTHTEDGLRRLSQAEGGDIAAIAGRLLTRAVRAARPRRMFDTDAIRAANAPFAAEDAALADSASTERADLLAQEDAE